MYYSLESKVLKGSQGRKNCFNLEGDKFDDGSYFAPTGLCIIKDICGT